MAIAQYRHGSRSSGTEMISSSAEGRLLFERIPAAPAPVGPFSHAVEAGGWIFVTGQMPTIPGEPARPLADGIEPQTRQVMANLHIVLRGLGLDWGHVARVGAYLTRFEQDYASFNRVYASYFPPKQLPARTCIGVAALACGAVVEVDLIAYRSGNRGP
jgi:reactive intermediate/imine deaminase